MWKDRATIAESALIEVREALRLALWEPVAFVTKAKGALSLREMEQATGIDHNTVGRFLQGEIVNSFSLMPLLRWAALATEAWRTTDYNPEMVKEILTAKDTTPVKAPEGVKDFMRWLDEESPEGLTQAETPPAPVAEVIAERRRQVDVEGWTAEHDDEHPTGTLGLAAAAYVLDACGKHSQRDLVQQVWPFDQEWWKPKDPRRDLIRAAALIIAEIERLDRLDGQREKE